MEIQFFVQNVNKENKKMKSKEYPMLNRFIQMQIEHEQTHPKELFPIPIDNRQFIIDCFLEGLLGPDWYTTWPCGDSQINPMILNEILLKYSKPYRRLVRQKQKEIRNAKD